MCTTTRSVAKITGTLAFELGVDFKDNNGNYVVSLQLASELEIGEFTIIPANYTQSIAKGILPVNPRKPIIRPKP